MMALTWRSTAIRMGRLRSTARSIRRGRNFDRRPVAIDFYNNYMTNFHDNPFETDGGMHNIRVMRNMMINSASHAFCNQPAVGGPGVLDQERRLSPARRIEPSHRRVGGRASVQQHDPVGDLGER